MPGPAKKPLSPLTKRSRHQRLDGRTFAGRTERRVVRELTAHVGGQPSAPERILIARAARLVMVIEMLERRLIEKGEVSDHSGRQILAWVNSLRLIMQALGLERPSQQPASLRSYLGGRAA